MAITRLSVIALKKLAKKFGKKEAKKRVRGKVTKAPEESLTTGKFTKEELERLNRFFKHEVESKTRKTIAFENRALEKRLAKQPKAAHGGTSRYKQWRQDRRRVRRGRRVKEEKFEYRKPKKKNNKKENESESTGFII